MTLLCVFNFFVVTFNSTTFVFSSTTVKMVAKIECTGPVNFSEESCIQNFTYPLFVKLLLLEILGHFQKLLLAKILVFFFFKLESVRNFRTFTVTPIFLKLLLAASVFFETSFRVVSSIEQTE